MTKIDDALAVALGDAAAGSPSPSPRSRRRPRRAAATSATACRAVSGRSSRCCDDLTKRYTTAELARHDPGDPDVIRQATECLQKLANGAPADAGSAAPPSSGVPGLPPMPARREADALIGTVRAWSKHPRMALAAIRVAYVDSEGVLDDEFGTIRLAFGASRTPVDDPKRKTGAPIKADDTAPPECPTLYGELRSWGKSESFCAEVPSYIPKCTVVEIWKRAIKDGAPKDALAVIDYDNDDTPSWSFNISDEPRKVNVSKSYNDDCERTLEKPQSESPK